jgi:hypothetical protein
VRQKTELIPVDADLSDGRNACFCTLFTFSLHFIHSHAMLHESSDAYLTIVGEKLRSLH